LSYAEPAVVADSTGSIVHTTSPIHSLPLDFAAVGSGPGQSTGPTGCGKPDLEIE